jgi:hypothetical protein
MAFFAIYWRQIPPNGGAFTAPSWWACNNSIAFSHLENWHDLCLHVGIAASDRPDGAT